MNVKQSTIMYRNKQQAMLYTLCLKEWGMHIVPHNSQKIEHYE